MAVVRSKVISLYKMMMTESNKFPSYNYRTYAVRRVRDAFRAIRQKRILRLWRDSFRRDRKHWV